MSIANEHCNANIYLQCRPQWFNLFELLVSGHAMRVPKAISLRYLVGEEAISDEGDQVYQQLSPRDAKRLVQRFGAALRSHARDFEKGGDKENALGAFEGALGALLELRDARPELKADIDVVLARNGHTVFEH